MLDRLRQSLRRARAGDCGMTLIEVMVACAILLMLSTAVYGVLLTALKTTNDDKLRVAASGLAARQIDILRQEFADPTKDPVSGLSVGAEAVIRNDPPLNPNPLDGNAGDASTVDGVPFEVTVSVTVQTLAGKTPCDASGTDATHPSYVAKATVTWPHMGATQPVVNETILTPTKQIVDGAQQSSPYGYLAIAVTDHAGNPTAGVTADVVAADNTKVVTPPTDSSGCTVVSLRNSGTYTATLDTPGYVTLNGSGTKTATVTTGEIAQLAMSYDKAAAINASFVTDSADGFQLPATLPGITLYDSGLGGSASEAAGTEWQATTNLTDLWPFSDGYALWAGSCADADPTASGGARPAPVAVTGGLASSAEVALAPLDVMVVLNDGSPPPPGATFTVTAVDQTGTDCQSDNSLTLGTTNIGSAELKTSLPYGSWTISVNGNALAGSADETVNASGSPVTATVVAS